MNSLHRSTLALTLAVPIALAAHCVMAQPFPQFSHPTQITNPYWPVSNNRAEITVGVDNGAAFRSEVTLLPTTRLITWAGGTTEVLVTQFVAYADGDLLEVAYDHWAQADDGAAYYFGEDVFNYQNGRVANHNGTWRAGRDGAPPGVIMPAHPFVGQVFHPENFRPVVFEEDTVLSLTEPTTTPLGPINSGLLVHELLLDGSIEFKVYARGWGQVEAREPNVQNNLVLLNRVDAPNRKVPRALDAIESGAECIMANPSNRTRVLFKAAAIAQQWNAYRARAVRDGAPVAFVDAANAVLARLNAAIAARDAATTTEAANDLRAAVTDLADFYNPRVPADLARLDVLQREVILDVRAGDFTAATVEYAKAADAVWARLRPSILLRRGGAGPAAELDGIFAQQSAALDAGDANAAIRAARKAIDTIDEMEEDLY